MRLLLILPFFLVLIEARPQDAVTSTGKLVQNNSQIFTIRYTNYLRDIFHYGRFFVPVSFFKSHKRKNNNNNNSNTPRPARNPLQRINSNSHTRNVTNKIQNKHSIQQKNKVILHRVVNSSNSKLNKNKTVDVNNKNVSLKEKHWPYTEIVSQTDLNNYNEYTNTATHKRRPSPSSFRPQQVFTKVSNRPVSNNKDQNWFEIKLKPVPQYSDTTLHSKPSPLPVKVKDKPNLFVGSLPSNNVFVGTTVTQSSELLQPQAVGAFRPVQSVPIESLPANNVFVGTTVTLSPESLRPQGDGSFRPAQSENPCPTISITSNVIVNKEVCPDVDIVINNHISTNDNVYTDDEITAESENVPLEYEASEIDPEEVPLEEADAVDDVPAEDPGLDDVPGDAIDPETPQDSAGDVASSGNPETESSSSQGDGLDLPGLPERPDRPENEEESEGIFESGLSIIDFFNPFNNPFISFIVAPMILLATGTLGLSTFFIPWTVFPTIFLSRKAKESDLIENIPPVIRPDGWFWHNEYKTWTSLSQLQNTQTSKSNVNFSNTARLIFKFVTEIKKRFDSYRQQSWKRRKK